MIEGSPVIDVHHHFLPEGVFATLRAQAGGARRLVNDQISLTLSDDLYQVDRHLAAMDTAGVDTAILTYSGVSILGMGICQQLNDELAAVQAAYPGRLYGAVHVPLQQPAAAPRELERGLRELGLVAVALPTSAGPITLDAPSLTPLWEAIAALDAPIILHPALRPTGAPTEYHLERSCARPFDTTMAAVRIMHAVFPRFPTLRFVLPHLGGTAIFLKGRLRMLYEPADVPVPPEKRGLAKTVREQAALGLDAAFETAWRTFYFDTAGTGGWAPAVAMAVAEVGPERLLFGSDFPLESSSGETMRELVEMVAQLPPPRADLSEGWRAAIAGGTARALFPALRG